MLLRDFKNIHSGKKIIVCASGVSIQQLTENVFNKSFSDIVLIGCSHVNRYVQTDYLVCIDRAVEQINNDYEFIKNTNADFVFTQLNDEDLFISKSKKVSFLLGEKQGVRASETHIDYSTNTAYVACLLAYFMGAKKIGMIGNDFIDHNLTRNEIGLKELNQQYQKLRNNISVPFVNLSEKSLVKTIPYQSLNEF